jgi:hypothetical protein
LKLTFEDINDTSVTMKWLPPASAGCPEGVVHKYRVYMVDYNATSGVVNARNQILELVVSERGAVVSNKGAQNAAEG